MFCFSLRAVFRKESCMFCAGLFSIADLLGYEFVLPTALPEAAHRKLSQGGTARGRLRPTPEGLPQATVRTIRPRPPLFNPRKPDPVRGIGCPAFPALPLGYN